MKRIHGVLLAASIAAGGCIQGERAIRVEADGSGEIVDTVKLTGPFAEMLQGFAEMEEGTPEEKQAKQEEKLRAAAARMGPGVSLVSFEQAEDGTETITYAFADISKVSIEEAPSHSSASDEDEGDAGPSGSAPYTFRFEKDGSRVRVVVVNPIGDEVEEEVDAEAEADDDDDEMAEAMGEGMESMEQGMLEAMKPMLKGAHIRTSLTVAGSVVETNSPHADGSTITLMEVDFDEVMKSEEGLALLSQMEERPDPELMATVQGIKTSVEPEVYVTFEPGR